MNKLKEASPWVAGGGAALGLTAWATIELTKMFDKIEPQMLTQITKSELPNVLKAVVAGLLVGTGLWAIAGRHKPPVNTNIK